MLRARCSRAAESGSSMSRYPVAHDRRRVENAPLDADAGVERCGVAPARQVCCDYGAVQSEVYLVHRDGTAVQDDTLPLVGPYHLMVTSLVDHDDGDMGACPGELPVPSRLAQDRPGPGFRLLDVVCAVGLRLIYGFHGRLPSVSCSRHNRLG